MGNDEQILTTLQKILETQEQILVIQREAVENQKQAMTNQQTSLKHQIATGRIYRIAVSVLFVLFAVLFYHFFSIRN